MPSTRRVAIIGLGYVGLPLAVAMARHHEVTGFDVDSKRIAQLRTGYDRTREVAAETLRSSSLTLSSAPADLTGHEVYVVTVPTPVDENNVPDLGALRSASQTVGRALARGAIVVYESTVYPGVTEDVCGPDLETASGLACGRDFFLGYSPERVNPGDRTHTIERIVKVVAGQTPEVTAVLAELYGSITAGGVFVARTIRTAEAAKVIENAQRDINIAFINEVTMIFQRLGLSVQDVLETSRTKWNFLDFRPGLVGGHCIGVDPYYLAHCAQENDHHPEVILAGRRINDGMGVYVANQIADRLAGMGVSSGLVLVLGLTFKENVPDLRNSKVVDLIGGLRARGHRVEVHDSHAEPAEAQAVLGMAPLATLAERTGYDCVVGAVAHDDYAAFTSADLGRLVRSGGLVADVKGMWRGLALPDRLERWTL